MPKAKHYTTTPKQPKQNLGKYTELKGRFFRKEWVYQIETNGEELGGQNGYWATTKDYATVFVITTGPKKGMWQRVETHG